MSLARSVRVNYPEQSERFTNLSVKGEFVSWSRREMSNVVVIRTTTEIVVVITIGAMTIVVEMTKTNRIDQIGSKLR